MRSERDETIVTHEALVDEVLKAAGVAGQQGKQRRSVYERMESWLGLSGNSSSALIYSGNDNDVDDDEEFDESLTVEDCLPLPRTVFERTLAMLCQAWDPYGTSNATSDTFLPTLLNTRNPLEDAAAATAIGSTTPATTTNLSLFDVYPSIRVTKWLVAWRELRITLSSEREISRTALVGELLHVMENHPDQHNNNLILCLFQHIQDLPIIQAQFHSYTQQLRQRQEGGTSMKGHATTSTVGMTTQLLEPHTRLQQYRLAQTVAERFEREWGEHLDHLQRILGDLYSMADPSQRRVIRRLLGRVWQDFLRQTSSGTGLRMENTRAASVGLTLSLLHRIVLGIQHTAPLPRSYQQLLLTHLVPLHEPNAMVLWRDQTPVLELYHKALTQCIAVLVQKDPSLLDALLPPLLDLLVKGGNTSKIVLLLHEVDTYVGLLDKEPVGSEDHTATRIRPSWWLSLVKTLAKYMSSDHSRVAEQALQFFQNKAFERRVQQSLVESLPILLRALVSREPSWNPTVRKMTYHVLDSLQKHDSSTFEMICNQTYSTEKIFHVLQDEIKREEPEPSPTSRASNTALPPPSVSAPPVVTNHSLRAGMGTWKPPTTHSSSTRRPLPSGLPPTSTSQPPSTVTGVAPWAAAPPLTITGVAPWAVSNRNQQRTQPRANGLASIPDVSSINKKRVGERVQVQPQSLATQPESEVITGADYVQSFIQRIKPMEENDGISAWSKAQLAETPTLLPNLKFHDLVFGHELGTGSFSTVKYARLIERNKTRSYWAEYAVKIISTDKIRAMSYESSVQREIAVLRILSHPGIARLISNFRFREGAYLVLEYASRGDLHSLLKKHGSIDHSSTRFVIGEVVAALCSIHDAGFVFADLKPENIVITEPGHIKLTDFGGCRPVTEDAKARVKHVAKDLLKNLRDGDWKTHDEGLKQQSSSESHLEETNTPNLGEDDEDDSRVEGTTAYLPPEVVMGGHPSFSADSWALGCVMFQCLSGRPPLLENDDYATRRRIVDFEMKAAPGSAVDRLFAESHATSIEDDAKRMIMSVLNPTPSARPSMPQIATMDFFTGRNVDVFALHRLPAHPLDVGNVAPSPDSQWARRQLSSIWSPQPSAYNVDLTSASPNKGPASEDTSPITEGEEASGSFLPYTQTSKLPTPGLAKLAEKS